MRSTFLSAKDKLREIIHTRFGGFYPTKWIDFIHDCKCLFCEDARATAIETFRTYYASWLIGYDVVKCAACGRSHVWLYIDPLCSERRI